MKRILTFILIILISVLTPIYSQWELQKNYIPKLGVGRAIDACDSLTAIFYAPDENLQGLFITYDGGKNWNARLIPEGSITDIVIRDRNLIWYTTASGKIFYSTDGGLQWNLSINTGKEITYIKMFDNFFGIAAGDGENDKTNIMKTASAGVGWYPFDKQPTAKSIVDWRRIDFIDFNTGYFFSGPTYSKFHKTSDGGQSWYEIPFYGYAYLIKFFNKEIGITCDVDWNSRTYVISRTFDGGNSWETIHTNLQGTWPMDFEYMPGNPSQIWFVTVEDLYFSQDGGKTWEKQKVSEGELKGVDIVFVDKKHGWLLCTEGRIYHTVNGGGIISNVNNEEKMVFELGQNFPNPFNPETVINYQLGKRSYVTLKVYDLLGKEIALLVNGEKEPGNYSINFSAKEYPLSSGVYLYKLTTRYKSYIKKMVLIK
ncbi:MAG: T9SS type A sorting domain-containing protein [Melioribacteraceae bacterium]|nr:T9SS type A sorting domain-containing protein [Melioribacteraceae bacterium]